MKFLVTGSNGPGFASQDEGVALLEEVVHPSFERLLQLEADGKVIVSGLPVGERTIVFVLEVDSNDEADKIVQSLPIWPGMDWEVVALQDTSARFNQEKQMFA